MTIILIYAVLFGTLTLGLCACSAALYIPRKAGVTYNLLDKIGVFTNCALVIVYGVVSWYGFLLGGTSNGGTSLSECIAWATRCTHLPCLLGLAASVFLRKRGRRILGFLAQFLGVVYVLLILAIAAIV